MNDLARRNLKGPVSTLHSEFAEWDSDSKSWKPPWHCSMAHFRPDGQISKTEFQNPDGSVSRSVSDYDEAGRLRESRNLANNGPETKSVYSYDESGRLIRVVSIDRNGAQSDAANCSYDETGRKTAQICLPCDLSNGAVMSFAADSDDSDQSAETTWYDINHRFVRRMTFTRDRAGRLLQADVHVDVCGFSGIDTASPVVRGEMMAEMTKLLGPDRVMATTSYVYDDLGRLAERRIQMTSLGDNGTSYEYDDRGNPIEEVTVYTQREMQSDQSGNPHFSNETSQTSRIHYDYQYDTHANWTERVFSARSEASSPPQRSNIERREISYYAYP